MPTRQVMIGGCVAALVIVTLGAAIQNETTTGSGKFHASHDLKRGEDYYGDVCSPCHGATGEGDGPVSKYLRVKPRDFTRAQFKFRSTASGQLPLDVDLFRTITGGLPNTAM